MIFTDEWNLKVFLDLLQSVDLLVDPCATTAGNAFAFPMAAVYEVPVIAFSTCGSIEWLHSETNLIVRNVSLEAMAEIIMDYRNSVVSYGSNTSRKNKYSSLQALLPAVAMETSKTVTVLIS